MKTTLPFLCCAALLALGSCATVKQNLDARSLLAKCQYEYAGISVSGVKFGEGVEIASVDFDVNVKVTNTADKDIAVDHAEFSFYLDGNRVLDIGHERFARLAPASSSVEPIAAGIPFSGILKALGHRPEKIGVKAKLWVTILVGKDSWESPLVVPLEVEVAIPYDQIDVLVAQKKRELEDAAKAKLEAEAERQAAEAAKKLLPSAPHF
jgi:hypothetical protein